MTDFIIILYVLIDNVEYAKTYVYRIDGVDGGEMDVTGLKSTNLAKSKFALEVDDQFAISENQIKARLPDPIVAVDIRK
ncbi:hypothetical protein AVEN_94947-1 [Araneus ventricosus]|uniref:Uncharacterized protein n=1 Tax=Araneus ventricosus TaxID=182803 RepID=A0A4Y2DI50_ARAVE|nr:hypothetical protein AVEN_94947-1 [Araneus ventricosus]